MNSPSAAGVEGEIELINRQIYEGAEYVYVASGFYPELYKYIKDQGLKNRVRFIENGNCSDEKNSIIADDYAMGLDYGNYILDSNFARLRKIVTFLSSKLQNTLLSNTCQKKALKIVERKEKICFENIP